MTRRIHLVFVLFLMTFLYIIIFSDMSMQRASSVMQQLYEADSPGPRRSSKHARQDPEAGHPRRCDDHIRKMALMQYCKTQHKESPMNTTNIRSHIDYIITVDEEHRTMFCALPKVGSSTWMAFLVQERLPVYVKDVDWEEVPIHEPDFHHALGIKHINEFHKTVILEKIHTYFKFLIVRHPFERLVSAYYDKFLRTEFGYRMHYRPFIVDHFRKGKRDKPMSYYAERDHHMEMYVKNGTEVPERFLEGRTTEEAIDEFWAYHKTNKSSPYLVTFPEFLQFVLNMSDDRKQDQHWRSILHSCFPCDVNYDIIGKLETLEEDSEVIIDRMGATGPLRYSSLGHLRDHETGEGKGAGDKKKHSNKYPMKRKIPEFDDVDRDIVERLLEVYRGDLLAFGYSWDLENNSATCSLDWLGETCC